MQAHGTDPTHPFDALDAALFVALLATALALGPALAHLFELPNKLALPRDQYFVVQQIYRGWNLLAVVLAAELAGIVAVMVQGRRQRAVLRAAIVALACLGGAQALFWLFTQPANLATESWTAQPDTWQALRREWEFSHAGGAVLKLVAFMALVRAALVRTR